MTRCTHLLDTNICSYLMRSRPESVVQKLMALGRARVAVSVVTAVELLEGAELSRTPRRYHEAIGEFLAEIPVLPLTADVAPVAAKIRARLRRSGKPIGDMDTLIAAHASALGLVLVTHNTREFARVSELLLEDWG